MTRAEFYANLDWDEICGSCGRDYIDSDRHDTCLSCTAQRQWEERLGLPFDPDGSETWDCCPTCLEKDHRVKLYQVSDAQGGTLWYCSRCGTRHRPDAVSISPDYYEPTNTMSVYRAAVKAGIA